MRIHFPASADSSATADSSGHTDPFTESANEIEGFDVRTSPTHDIRDAADGVDDAAGLPIDDGFNTQGDHDLADRAALRRVAGPVHRAHATSPRSSTASCSSSGSCWSASGPAAPAAEAEASMAELARLAETAGSDRPRRRWCSAASHPDGATYIGSGKVPSCCEIVEAHRCRHRHLRRRADPQPAAQPGGAAAGQGRRPDRADPGHLRPARPVQGGQGAGRARAAELPACPRLRGWGAALSRQRGGRVAAGAGIGSRGPGETKLEIDRRRIHKRISQLRHELARMRRVRDTKRSQRRANAVPAVVDRRLHQRGQVVPAEPADRRRGAGRGRAVRHPRPDHPPVPHRRRPGLHPDRHGRLRPAPAAPAGRVVPLDAGGDRRRRPAAARGRRLRRASRGAGRRRSARCSARSTRCRAARSSW